MLELGNNPADYIGALNNDIDPWGHFGFDQIPCDPSWLLAKKNFMLPTSCETLLASASLLQGHFPDQLLQWPDTLHGIFSVTMERFQKTIHQPRFFHKSRRVSSNPAINPLTVKSTMSMAADGAA